MDSNKEITLSLKPVVELPSEEEQNDVKPSEETEPETYDQIKTQPESQESLIVLAVLAFCVTTVIALWIIMKRKKG